jgi:hypothetical protein
LGRSISSRTRGIEKWSWVELNLAILPQELIRNRRRDLVSAAFHAPINFRDQLRMVDVVARRILTGRRLKRWDQMHEAIGNKARNRNEIAHFSIMLHGKTTPDARLHPYWSVTKGTPAGQGLTAKQLEDRAQSFTDLSFEILEFARSLPRQLRRPSKPRPRKRQP